MKREVTAEELARPMVPYQEARAQILDDVQPLKPTRVLVEHALGLVASEPIVADLDVPGFDNSAMDGYAIRAADTADAKPVTLRLVDEIPAGVVGAPLEPGTAATIMTGAPMPPGADAVVPWEDADARGGTVVIGMDVPVGRHVRPRGEDIAMGSTIIDAGTRLRAVHLGVLASLGRFDVGVVPRPTIAVLSTGDELLAPGDAPAQGKVYDANRALLRAMCAEAGGDVVAADALADDPDQIEAWLHDAAARADLVVTTGGASVGEHDWIRAILERAGELKVWRVAIKPGKPVAFARLDGTPVLGLPGNPGSAFVGMHVFVQPVIRILGGGDPEPRRVRARLGAPVKNKGRTLFCRVQLDGEVAHPMPAQSSVVLSNVMDADGYAIIAPGGMDEGAEVTVELLRVP